MSKAKQLGKIKSSLFSRSLSLAKLSLSTGAKIAAHGVIHGLQSQDFKNEKWKELLTSQAKILTDELGQLKGSLMKAGQMLSIYGEHFFPPEANQFLKLLQQDSPPLKWEVMEKILVQHLGRKSANLLDIDPVPIGTASLGQVHKAIIKATGEVIALKIQYPNVDTAIDSDLRAIRSLLYLVKLLPKDFNTDPILNEIRQMLVQETNYELEAQLTEKYADLLKLDQRYVVPRVYRQFSNRKVLATSYEEGLRVDDPRVQTLNAERRNQLALDFMDLYFKEIFEWKFVQTDPHFGNYKIRLGQDGVDKILLFDFGATRAYPDSFMQPYHKMIKAMYYNDLVKFEKFARELSFLKDDDSEELIQIFSEICFDLVEPFLAPEDPRNKKGLVHSDGTYDWHSTDLPQRSSDKIFKILKNFKWRIPPQEIIFLDRKAAGVFVFLSHLKVRIRGRDLLESYLKKISF